MAVVANLDAILGAKIEKFDRGIDGAIVSTSELQAQLKEAGITQREWNKIVKEGASVTAAMRTPMEVYEQEMRDLDRLLKAGQISQETYNRAVTKSKAALNAASPAQQRMNKLMAEGRAVTASLRTPLEIYEKELVQLNQLLHAGAISQETFNRAVVRANATLAAAGSPSVLRGAIGNVTTLGTSFATLGSITALAKLGKDTIDFEEQLNQSTSIIGGLTDELRADLTNAAVETSAATKASAIEAAEAYFFLFSAGLDAQKSIASLPQVAKFAQAGNFDLALATDLATDSQSALGLAADETSQHLINLTRVTDTLIAANTLSNATAQQFSEAITNKAGAAIRGLGKDVEEGVAVLAAFADQGTKGAEAGTQLAIVIRDLQTKAIKFEREFAEANIRVFEGGEVRNFADIVADLERELGHLSDEAKKTKLLELGFSDKSVSAIEKLFGTSEKIRAYEAALRDAGGTTEDVAENQFTALSRATNNLEAAIDKLTTKNQALLDLLTGLAQNSATVIENLNQLSELASSFEIDAPGALGFSGGFELFNELTSIENIRESISSIDFNKSFKENLQALAKNDAAEVLRRRLGPTPDEEAFNGAEKAIERIQKQVSAIEPIAAVVDDDATKAAEKEMKKLQDRADQIAKSLRTPMEVFKDNVGELNQLLDIGAINATTFERAVAKEKKQLEELSKKTKEEARSLGNTVRDSIARNSEKAFEIIFGKRGTEPPEVAELQKGNDLQKETLDEIKKQTTTLKRALAAKPVKQVADW